MQPQPPQINPYGAPQAPVSDYVAADHPILERARAVPAGHALAWYGEAWRLFKVSLGVWIGIWVVMALIVIVLGFVPIVGGIAASLLTPVFIGGAAIAAQRADREGDVRFGDLFAGFSGRAGTLMLIGLLQLLLSILIIAVTVLFAVIYLGTAVGADLAQMSPEEFFVSEAMVPLAILILVVSLIFIPVTNAVWLASCLAALHDIGAIEALRRGFSATFRNLLPIFLFAVITVLLAIVASIPLLLGWLVLGPVLLCVVYAQYRDLFGATDPASGTVAR